MRLLLTFLREENGSNVIEYGLIASMISIAAIGGMMAVGVQVGVFYDSMVTALGGR
jgi:Flp pilus assembly pilin Flp